MAAIPYRPTSYRLEILLGPSPRPQNDGTRNRVRGSAMAVHDLVLIASPDLELIQLPRKCGGGRIYLSRLPRRLADIRASRFASPSGLLS
jgi:hypothetical protein